MWLTVYRHKTTGEVVFTVEWNDQYSYSLSYERIGRTQIRLFDESGGEIVNADS